MANIYKVFNTTDDIVPGDVQTVSQPLWSENTNPLGSGSATTGIGFFTSSTQVGSSGNYYVNVYHRNPQAAASTASAAVQFAVAYGNRLGSGSVGDPNTVGNNTNDTPSRAIYSQYRNLLLPTNTTQFTFNGTGSDEIIAINVARSRFKQKVDPGNWTLRLGSGSSWSGSGALTSFRAFTDDSGANTDPSVGQAGRVFNIVSGSDGTQDSSDSRVYGSFYPDAGLLIFHAGLLRSQLGIPFNSASAVQAQNHVTASTAISASSYFAARSEEQINSTNYFVRVINNQFNFTNNPTFVSGSDNQLKYSSMVNNPSVYVTSIGLYNNNNELLAVAKLSQPLLKSFNREALVKVKLDY
jgi:hypothetical protein